MARGHDVYHRRCTFEPVRPAQLEGFVVQVCRHCGRTTVRRGEMPAAVQNRLEGLEPTGRTPPESRRRQR